ncbi:hypothetical protein [Streptomyces anulatus]|uniref:hypothetical protein n=1 Tax=Streptomyces anulatus TaxID=1892 RepID=UPI00225C3D98|nr:hypothetical protein [Streptomyces anulatus]MCX4504341.1 hypothetical protein [Streptomyces anulatus]
MTAPAPELPLPDPASLSDEQLRGAHCVWCEAELSNATAEDLGPRSLVVYGSTVRWYPRCCATCWKKGCS